MNRLAVVFALAASLPLFAGEYNPKVSIGDKAFAWSNLPGIDGKKHSLADLKDKDVVVLVFTCNSCATAMSYEERIVAFVKKHCGEKSRVALVAANVNTIDADRLDKMKDRAKEKGFNFPYIYDESQKLAKEYGATYTPEFFVLDKDRRIAYMGAMDNRSPPAVAKELFLERAVEAVLAGKKPDKAETLARGCMIRYARPKR